jgi:hypothetical protein
MKLFRLVAATLAACTTSSLLFAVVSIADPGRSALHALREPVAGPERIQVAAALRQDGRPGAR